MAGAAFRPGLRFGATSDCWNKVFNAAYFSDRLAKSVERDRSAGSGPTILRSGSVTQIGATAGAVLSRVTLLVLTVIVV